ncbi:MAG: hypothetical protein RSE31_08560, partial [Anaerovoracaceae bacterium]
MDTLDELVYYCNEGEPVGALLLTGEWGCGKTYLLDHDFREKIKNSAVVLRISLFGITSPDEINLSIKQAWMGEYSKTQGMEEISQKINTGKEIVSKLEFLPEWIRGIASTDMSVFIPLNNKMGDKKVVLVFDDLERCRMNIVDVLGIINEYCENQKYHTIIVANQDKIQDKEKNLKIVADMSSEIEKKQRVVLDIQGLNESEKEKIPYIEIKEKIIQRTVCYTPNYKAIVHAVINDIPKKSEDYKNFLKTHEDDILALFAPDRERETKGEETLKMSHNIRSLKCALNDFYRVFCELRKNEIENIHYWLFSFISYVIANKAGNARGGAYGTIFTDEDVEKIYPLFHDKYMLRCAKTWILKGVWNKELLDAEIDFIKEQARARTPVEIIRMSRIVDIEEDAIQQGFEEFLKLAYNGELTLNEYVLLIENAAWARSIEYKYPMQINWERIKQGISVQIEKIKAELPDGQILRSFISKENANQFEPNEWAAYMLISKFAIGDDFMFWKNKKFYIEKMGSDRSSSFQLIENKRFDIFDEEMATVTAMSFEAESNAEKCYFARACIKMWKTNLSTSDMNAKNSLSGFMRLKALLEKLREKLVEGHKGIAQIHTSTFIDGLVEIIG